MANTFLDRRVVKDGSNSFVGQKNPFDLNAFVAHYITGALIPPVGPLLVFKNGLNFTGTTVRYGGLLTGSTTIVEDIYDHTHSRTDDPAGNGDVTTLYESTVADPIGAGNALVRRLFASDSINTGNAEVGVLGDADANSAAYMRSEGVNNSCLLTLNSNSLYLATFTGAATDGAITFAGGLLSMNSVGNSGWIVNGTRVDSFVDKIESIGSSFSITKTTLEVDSTINSLTPVIVLTLTSPAQSQSTVTGILNYRKNGLAGAGSINFVASFYNHGGYTIQSPTLTVLQQEDDIADAVTVDFKHTVSVSGWELGIDPNELINTRIQGILEVTTVAIPAAF